MNEEMFVTLKDFENYEININGQVRNKKTKRILKPRINTGGYLRFSLKNKDGKKREVSQHRLLKLTFDYIEGCENLFVDHINCNKTDNRLSNLEWVTHKENVHRAIKNNLIKNHHVVINDEMVLSIRKEYIPNYNGNLSKLKNKYRIGKHSLLDIIANRTFKHLPKTEEISEYYLKMKEYPYYSGEYYDKLEIPKDIQQEIIYKHNYYFRTKVELSDEYKIPRKTIESIIFGKYKHKLDRNTTCVKLTEKDVKDIKNKIKNGYKIVDIAKEYNMHPTSISNISTGKTWSCIK